MFFYEQPYAQYENRHVLWENPRYDGVSAGAYGKECRSVIVPKDDAKKDGADALKPDRDIKPSAATGTKITPLKLHLAKEYIDTLWLPDGLGEDERRRRMKSAVAMLKPLFPK